MLNYRTITSFFYFQYGKHVYLQFMNAQLSCFVNIVCVCVYIIHVTVGYMKKRFFSIMKKTCANTTARRNLYQRDDSHSFVTYTTCI